MKFTRKPIVVEAILFNRTQEGFPEILQSYYKEGLIREVTYQVGEPMKIITYTGSIDLSCGEYLVRVGDRLSAVPFAEFESTHAPLDEESEE